jgi:predicted O-methyltransferase YrrM
MDTQEFFAQNKETFDLIFIDADHSFEAVRADFYGAMDILNPGGLLVLHDTDPENDALMADGYCGDSYRIVTEFLFREANSYAFITLPLNEAGITLVQRRFDTRVGLRSP